MKTNERKLMDVKFGILVYLPELLSNNVRDKKRRERKRENSTK
jgi:hypothetical protein